jgi:hypothetical protein
MSLLPVHLQLTAACRYTGLSQIPPYSRYALLLGPIIMSFQGAWDYSNTTDSTVMIPHLTLCPCYSCLQLTRSSACTLRALMRCVQVMPKGLDVTRPADWLLPATRLASLSSTAEALHYVVAGSGGAITAKPYFEVQAKGEMFTNYPCFR